MVSVNCWHLFLSFIPPFIIHQTLSLQTNNSSREQATQEENSAPMRDVTSPIALDDIQEVDEEEGQEDGIEEGNWEKREPWSEVIAQGKKTGDFCCGFCVLAKRKTNNTNHTPETKLQHCHVWVELSCSDQAWTDGSATALSTADRTFLHWSPSQTLYPAFANSAVLNMRVAGRCFSLRFTQSC